MSSNKQEKTKGIFSYIPTEAGLIALDEGCHQTEVSNKLIGTIEIFLSNSTLNFPEQLTSRKFSR